MVYLEWAEIPFVLVCGFAYKNLFPPPWRNPLGADV